VARVRTALSMYKSARKMLDKAHEFDPDDRDIQRLWINTLPIAERIKYLEFFLANASESDVEERSNTQHYLDYLKARMSMPRRACRLANKVTATETPLVRLLENPVPHARVRLERHGQWTQE
jgi:hypothetical protein